MQLLIGHGQVPTIMPEASNLLFLFQIPEDISPSSPPFSEFLFIQKACAKYDYYAACHRI